MLVAVVLALLAFAIGAYALLTEFRGPLGGWLVRGALFCVVAVLVAVSVDIRNDIYAERRAAEQQRR